MNNICKWRKGLEDLPMYESPIEVMFRDIENRIREQEENAITAEVSRQMGVNVDKDELMKALAYDRDQYNRGYEDAKRAYESPKGEWLEWEDERWGGVWHYCSNCHNDALYKRVDGTFKQILSDYCPNCGADMREDTDDETEDD